MARCRTFAASGRWLCVMRCALCTMRCARVSDPALMLTDRSPSPILSQNLHSVQQRLPCPGRPSVGGFGEVRDLRRAVWSGDLRRAVWPETCAEQSGRETCAEQSGRRPAPSSLVGRPAPSSLVEDLRRAMLTTARRRTTVASTQQRLKICIRRNRLQWGQRAVHARGGWCRRGNSTT